MINVTRTTLSNALGRRGRWLAALLLGLALLASQAAEAQIAFRSAASSSAKPPAFRAAASSASSISFVGAGAQVARETAGSITPAIPAGTAANDFAVLIIAGRPTDTSNPAAPAGWTLRSSSLREVGNEDLKIVTYYRVLAGGDADPSITLPSNWVSTLTGMSGQIAVWRGVNTATPFDVADVTGTDSNSDEFWTPPSITTVTGGAWVVSAVATSDDNQLGFDSAQGFTLRMSGTSYDTTLGGDHAIGLADKVQPTAGAATMPNWEQLNNENDYWAGITFALRPVATALVIDKPAGTVQNDVMIASIGVQPSTASTPTLPSGWTLVRRIDNSSATTNSLLIYRRVAGASEPAFYSWTSMTGATFAVGGIQSFSEIDTTTPIDVESTGQATASGTAHVTLAVTTTMANTMVVTSHTYASSRTWSPTGMTKAFDQPSGANSATGQSITGNYVLQAAAGTTGTKTATAAGDADRGNAHILALRPLTPALTITKPAGTVAGDFMVAAIGIQDDAATITPPSGWTLVRRIDQTSGTDNSLAVYTRVAGGSEPASYTWGVSGSNFSHAVGGIQSFSGVDTAAAVNVENGQTTSSDVDHDTPDITPTVANTMLVTAHTFASSRTWTPPTGMTQAYDTASLPVSDSQGQSIIGSYAPHVFLATGVKTATASGDSDTGNAHILALRPLAATGVAGGFNAYDTTTAAGAATGFVRTKIAGSTVSVAIISLNLPRTAIETTFTGTVRVEVLNASNNSGALDAYGCRSSWTVLQTISPDPAFIAGDLGRKTVSFTQANSYNDLRLKISFPTSSPTRIGCSNDNFALRPNTYTSYSVTDADWQTAGTTRTLNNSTTMPLGITHKAGRPFTVQATAVNGAGSPATTTNYTGAPTPALTDCGGSNPCTSTLGTVTLGSSFILGVLTANTASYNYAGSFNMRLEDRTFSSVDASDGTPADCSAGGQWVCSNTIAVGRFVPDHFTVALNTPSFGTACGAFTYMGQNFNYSTAPAITVTARNFAGVKINNYAGNLWQITAASLTGKSYTTAAGTLNTTGITGTDPAIDSTTPGAGAGTLTFRSPSFFNATTGFFFTRTTPVAPFDADISLAINVIDADTISYASNPARFGQATAGNGIAFSSGKPMRFGRLVIRNANGSQLLPLPVQMEAQYWSGAPTNAFITNTLDNCTSIASANDAMGTYTGNLSGSPTCETAISGGGALNMGRRTLLLAAPGSGNTGSVNLTVNLGAAASGSTCTTQGGAPGSATTANSAYLQGNWTGVNYDQNPTARATFGVSRGAEEVIFVRENF